MGVHRKKDSLDPVSGYASTKSDLLVGSAPLGPVIARCDPPAQTEEEEDKRSLRDRVKGFAARLRDQIRPSRLFKRNRIPVPSRPFLFRDSLELRSKTYSPATALQPFPARIFPARDSLEIHERKCSRGIPPLFPLRDSLEIHRRNFAGAEEDAPSFITIEPDEYVDAPFLALPPPILDPALPKRDFFDEPWPVNESSQRTVPAMLLGIGMPAAVSGAMMDSVAGALCHGGSKLRYEL